MKQTVLIADEFVSGHVPIKVFYRVAKLPTNTRQIYNTEYRKQKIILLSTYVDDKANVVVGISTCKVEIIL